MKLTTLATMSATVEAKTSSIISCATLRLLAPGHPVIRGGTGLYGFQEPVPCTIHCDRTESHATLRLLAPGHPVIHTGLYGFQEPVPSTLHCDLTEGETHRSPTCCQDTDLHEAPTVPFISPPIINVIAFQSFSFSQ